MEAVARLQKLDPDKLNELCRMHLTFNLDLHDDEFSALMDLRYDEKNKKVKSYFKRRVKDKLTIQFMPLTQENISQIYQIIEFLGRDKNVCTEGLFRKTGSIARQHELKTLLRVGEQIDFNTCQYSVHDCACVLKCFLSELPEPLLSEAHYSAHCQITDMCHENTSPSQRKALLLRQLKATKLLFLLLPSDNCCLLKYLLLLLSQVRDAQEKNKMTATNLATMFAPHIICPRKMSPDAFKENFSRMVECVKFLIENATVLFEPPNELVQDILTYLKKFPFAESDAAVAEPVNTIIAFCDRVKVSEEMSMNYTNKALAELHNYIQNLPDSARKRKLVKKFQKENACEPDVIGQPARKHFRSRSVGEAIKKRLWKGKKADDFFKGFHHSTFDMVASNSKSTESIPTTSKASSEEILYFSRKETKFPHMGKNLLRASKKLKFQKF